MGINHKQPQEYKVICMRIKRAGNGIAADGPTAREPEDIQWKTEQAKKSI
jgi:hypothetical protein